MESVTINLGKHINSSIDTIDAYFEKTEPQQENSQLRELQNKLDNQLKQLELFKEKILDHIHPVVDSNKYVTVGTFG
jgi:hypothetical protein